MGEESCDHQSRTTDGSAVKNVTRRGKNREEKEARSRPAPICSSRWKRYVPF